MTVHPPDMGDVWMMLAKSWLRNNRHALAAAARQGGDVKQAPAESPQSGGRKPVTPISSSPPSESHQ